MAGLYKSWELLYRLLALQNLHSELGTNFFHLILSSVTFSNTSLCLFVQFLLKHILGSGYCVRHPEGALWMFYCSTKLSKFVPCLFVSQTFYPRVNFIWIISIIKWKNSGVRVTCKGKALCDKQHHGGVDTKSAVFNLYSSCIASVALIGRCSTCLVVLGGIPVPSTYLGFVYLLNLHLHIC